jgi:hypothetical protein
MGTWMGMCFLFIVFVSIFVYFKILKDKNEKKLSLFLLGWYFLASFLGMCINVFVMHVYHHRLFFFESWIIILLLARSLSFHLSQGKEIKVAKVAFWFAMFALVVFCVIQVNQYMSTISRELAIVSNGINGFGKGNVVLHESPFSILAAMYYAPDQEHYVYSELTDRQLASAGRDVIPDNRIINNINQINFSEYYYYEHDGNLRVPGYNCRILLETDGLNLVRCEVIK